MYIKIYLFLCITTLLSCKHVIEKPVINQPDTTWIKHQLSNYDSVYNIFYATDRTSDSSLNIRIQSHVYLDSILTFENSLATSNDTVTRKLLLRTLYYKGTDLNDMGKYTDATIFLNKYLALSNDANQPANATTAYVHKTIGDIYSRLGDYSLAVYHKKKSMEFYEANNDVVNISSEIIDLSKPFFEMGLYDSAINDLNKGLLLQDVADKRMLSIYTELAENYIKKNELNKAGEALQKGAVYFNKVKNSGEALDKLFSYNNTYANLLQQQKNYAAAIILLRQSLQFVELAYGNYRNRDAGKTYNQLGYEFQLINNKDSSIYYYNKALSCVVNIDVNNFFAVPAKNEMYAENTIIECLDNKAKWMFVYGKELDAKQSLQCAVDCYDRIMDVEYKLMQYFSYDNSKLLMLKESRNYSEKAIAACYQLYSLTKQEQWAEQAFRFAERSKSFILLESVKRNLAESILKNDTNYNNLQYAQFNYADNEKQLIEAKNTNDTSLIHSATIQLEKADEQLQLIKLKLNTDRTYKALTENENNITAQTVQEFLNKNHEGMIEYFIDSTSYCFSINPGKPLTMHQLNDSVISLSYSFINFFKDKNAIVQNVGLYNKTAYSLFKNLGLEQEAHEKNKFIIITDGVLNYVPFDALLTQPSASFNLASLNYLIKDCEINFNYSAAIMISEADYKYTKGNFVSFCPVFSQKQRGLAELPFSKEEISSARQAYPKGKYYENNEATLANFTNDASSAEVMHIASHASATDVPRIEFYDSTLYLDEIYAMQLHANLVILSGCETGGGEIETGEGVISLARGFYYAGAHSVITSLWNVDDNSTAQVFKYFYKNSGKGKYASALRNSKLNYLQSSISNDKFSPYYWAALYTLVMKRKLLMSLAQKKYFYYAVLLLHY